MKKIVQSLTCTLLALASSCFAANESSQAAYPLGVFHFDLGRLGSDEAGQIRALKSIGYSGLVLDLTKPNGLKSLERYQAAIEEDPFEVYAGYVSFHMDKDIDAQSAHLDKVIQGLKKSNAKFWLTLYARQSKSKPAREQIVDVLRSAADRAKVAGVELIIYPHDTSLMESAEEAIPYLEEVQNGNVSISLHLCHELRAGNGERLNEIAAKIKPWIAIPSISGADIHAVNEDNSSWDKSIKPLTLGDYDSSKLLKALKSVDYKGPVILHTYALDDEAIDHHETSFKRFQEMVAALDAGETSQTKKRSSHLLPEARRHPQPSRITPEAWRATRQEIRSATLEAKIDYLLDRAEIEDIITTYAYSVDTRAWPLHGVIFKDSFKDGAAAKRKIGNQERLEMLNEYFKRFTSTQHLGFPLVIQLEGDTAYATASLHARHYDENGDPADNTLLWGQYEFWFERTSEGWKVSKLAQVNRTEINTSVADLSEEDAL